MRRTLGFTWLVLVATACGPDPSSRGDEGSADRHPPSPQVQDSAGVELVYSAAPSWAEGDAWEVEAEPEAVLDGWGDPSFGLFRVVDLALLRGGRVAVANAGSGQIAVLGPDGALTTTLGRDGDGPGEFAWLNGVLTRGDTVVGVDGATLRLSLFAPDGSLAREISVDPEQGVPTGIRVVALGDNGIGVFREVGFASKEMEPGITRLPGSAFVLSWAGERTPGLDGDFPGGSIFVAPDAMGTLPYGADLHLAGSEEGFVVGDGAVADLRVYGPGGDLYRRIRWEHVPDPVDASAQEAWREAQIAEMHEEIARGSGGDFGGKAGSAEARRQLETQLRGMFDATPFPETFPVFAGLLVDETGHLWVERDRGSPGSGASGPAPWQGKGGAVSGPGPGSWWIFSPEGRWLGSVDTPAGLEVHAVTTDAIWGVFTDSLGVESVRRHALTR